MTQTQEHLRKNILHYGPHSYKVTGYSVDIWWLNGFYFGISF